MGPELAAELQRLLRSTYGPEVIATDGATAGLYAMPGQVGLFARRCKNPVLVTGTNGVGAKLRLAQAVGKHDAVGADLVAHCVNDVLERGALPLFFLSYLASGQFDPSRQVAVVKGVAEGCREADCALLGNEAVERPGVFGPGDYELAGFAVGVVERARLIDGRRRVRPGDRVLGLLASGLHASGFELARRVLFDEQRMKPDQAVPELGCTLGEELLKPTRPYVRSLRAVLDHYRVKGVVHGLAHVAAGGLVGSVPRVLGRRCIACIRKDSWPRPPVFELIARRGEVAEDEMLRTFNMGVGMVAIVAPYYADAIAEVLGRRGERVAMIGEVVRGEGPAVQLV